MGTAAAILAEARTWLGTTGRPNALTRAYAGRHGPEFLSVPWCDIAVTEWARRSGNAAQVTPAGDRAYTVWHAEDFRKAGRWHPGTIAELNAAKPGDIVFFDWGGTNGIGAIDHVGVIEKVLGGGRVQTIEGNTSDRCLRRVRSAGVIAGYGRPAYTPAKPSTPTLRLLRVKMPMMRGDDVILVQRQLNTHGARPKVAVDGVYGPRTAATVRAFQRSHKLEVDGIVGPKTRAALAKKL